MYNKTANYTRMTMVQKQKTRAALRADGIDPADLTAKEFVDAAKRYGFLKADAADTKMTAPTATDEQQDIVDPDNDTMTVDDDDDETDGEPTDETADDDADADETDDETDADETDEPAPADDETDDETDEETDDDEPAPADDEPAPEVPDPTNPMDMMIDERVAAHIAAHTHADEHRLPSPAVESMIAAAVAKTLRDAPAAGPIKIQINDAAPIELTDEFIHDRFEPALKVASRRHLNLYLKGPAGSGKTTLARQISTALGLKFYMVGKVDDAFTLTGYNDAGGSYVETDFYKACASPALFLFDEMDRYTAE